MANKKTFNGASKRSFITKRDYAITFKLETDGDNIVSFDTTIKGEKLQQHGVKKAIQLMAQELGYEHYYAHIHGLNKAKTNNRSGSHVVK
jgi:hypothetical protein